MRRLHGQLHWARPSKSAWLSVTYLDEHLFRSPLRAEFGTRLRLGEISLDAAAGANHVDGGFQAGYLLTGLEVYVSRAIALVAGAEYSPWSANGSPLTFSLGIRKALSLPLPLRAVPRVSGSVFEDLNGNGRQDGREPGLEGVVISIGPLKTSTGEDGSFYFRRAVPPGSPVQMDVGSIGEGYLALFSNTLVPAGGRIEMPVGRAATLDLTIFEDRDGDGVLDESESGLPGVLVVLRDPADRSYPRTMDAGGWTRFSALPPGRYEVVTIRNGQETTAPHIELLAGGRVAREIGLAAQTRLIKMQDGSTIPAPR